MELDVHVAVLVGAAVLRHALVLDALPGVGGDDLAGGAGDLEDAVIQVLDGERCAAESLRKSELLQICIRMLQTNLAERVSMIFVPESGSKTLFQRRGSRRPYLMRPAQSTTLE